MSDDASTRDELIAELEELRALRARQLVEQKRYRFLAENMADVVWTLDMEFRTTWVSPSIERVLGFTPDERLSQTIADMVTPSSLERIVTLLSDELQRDANGEDPERSPAITVEYFHGDGHSVWMESRIQAMRDERGELVGLYGSSRDVTGRLRAERALRQSEEMYRTLVEGSLQAVVIARADPVRLCFANRACARLLGRSVEELLAMDPAQLVELVHPEDRERFFGNFAGRIAGQDLTPEDTYRFVRSNGDVVWVRSYSSPFEFHGEAATLTAFVDETRRHHAEAEQRQLEQQLQWSQKMEAVGRLAGGIAHDFNNVLCAILGNAAIAAEELVGHPQQELIEEIVAAAHRASDLTRQLLAFSRRQVIETRALDLGEALSTLHSMLGRLIGEDISLRTELPTSLGTIEADPGQLEQIVVNLVVNARDAMPEGGDLTIAAWDLDLEGEIHTGLSRIEAGRYVVLEVRDTGFGMSADLRERIFEPFFTTKEAGQGTGMGLATVFGIVEQHGGALEVRSNPGAGSAFRVYFPRVEGKAGALSSSEVARPNGGRETVLVVEDEDMVRRLARRVLSRQGYAVLDAATPADAVALVEQHEGTIDLLLTDVVLPEMNGRQLARRLTTMRPSMKVLFTSGYSQDVIAHRGILDVGVSFLAKPWEPRRLAARVRETLDSP
jgi:PAS domain S-box-containing protein